MIIPDYEIISILAKNTTYPYQEVHADVITPIMILRRSQQ